ncbi:MAG: CopG family antitoxin [Pyrinomonadaceae bacterium]
MAENSEKKLPKFDSVEALTEFFDKNDMGDYFDSMPQVVFDVELGHRKHFVAVDEDVAEKLSEISKHEHLPSGAIVNSWLREKISDYTLKN